MSDKFRFFHRARVRAPLPVCWNVFTDYERFTEFTNGPVRLKRPGFTERTGLGAIRSTAAYGWEIDEITNIWRPHEVYGYHIINSPQIEAHQGIVRFFPTHEGGCEWVYDMQNVPRQSALDQIKETGMTYLAFISIGFKQLMDDLEAECERRADEERVSVRPPPTSDEALQQG